VDLPDGVKPQLGPLATAYGEVYRYQLVSDGTHSLMDLRELNDWVVMRRLLRVPGVAECANFGGYEKQVAEISDQYDMYQLVSILRRCHLLVSSRYHPMDVTWPIWPQVQTDAISSGFAL
jgi:Cu/Ag efflux pump CusA